MFFQGRGNVYLAIRDEDGNPGPYKLKICTDSFGVGQSTETGTHINKCGPVDVEDARFTKSQSATVSMTLAELEDKKFALGVIGKIVPVSAPGTVTGEVMPDLIENADVYFLGADNRHRTITALVITDSASPPATAALTTDYTIDAVTGKVTFVDVSGFTQPFKASYGYTDPQYVSIFAGVQQEYFLMYEFINKQNANDPGSYELYRVRFDPADNLDLQSDEVMSMTLNGSALADPNKEPTDDLGQFGRRVL